MVLILNCHGRQAKQQSLRIYSSVTKRKDFLSEEKAENIFSSSSKLYTYGPGEVGGQLVLDDKVEDGTVGGEPALEQEDGQGRVDHQELTAWGRSRLLAYRPANKCRLHLATT